ncbi:hypothetical protein MVEN_02571600 [Mycena venus]|uniref:Uncharacterized protein n=1 Tax=Mycena venus TaxID=2733690 RepID=A0A8H6U3E8_9AGAR|nr:hypothetical protein MVEN_02571600 [Mycena venus]
MDIMRRERVKCALFSTTASSRRIDPSVMPLDSKAVTCL